MEKIEEIKIYVTSTSIQCHEAKGFSTKTVHWKLLHETSKEPSRGKKNVDL